MLSVSFVCRRIMGLGFKHHSYRQSTALNLSKRNITIGKVKTPITRCLNVVPRRTFWSDNSNSNPNVKTGCDKVHELQNDIATLKKEIESLRKPSQGMENIALNGIIEHLSETNTNIWHKLGDQYMQNKQTTTAR